MATALPFPAHKHSPRKARPMGLLDVRAPRLPADQGTATALPESATSVESPAVENIHGSQTGVPGSPLDGFPSAPVFSGRPPMPDPGTLPSIPASGIVPKPPATPDFGAVSTAPQIDPNALVIDPPIRDLISDAPPIPTAPQMPDIDAWSNATDNENAFPKGKT